MKQPLVLNPQYDRILMKKRIQNQRLLHQAAKPSCRGEGDGQRGRDHCQQHLADQPLHLKHQKQLIAEAYTLRTNDGLVYVLDTNIL